METLRKTLRDRLDAFGIEPNRLLGQHFLVSEPILDAISVLSRAAADSTILEIGAGPGQLTEALLRTGAAVTAIEKDSRFTPFLTALASRYDRLRIIQDDARRIAFADVVEGAESLQVTGNLPYYITTELIAKSLTELPHANTMTFLIQTEAARRFMRAPGSKSYGPLNALMHAYGSADIALHVPASAFLPPPHVGSALLVLTRDHEMTAEAMKAYYDFLERLFATRRKTIGNNLIRAYGRQADTSRILNDLGISPQARVEALPPETLLLLFKTITAGV